ncbi:hypothetical protein [Limnothrix sp. FACHB-881]|nr:hypothetical protein [Limnothrix sp. FACHB-881]
MEGVQRYAPTRPYYRRQPTRDRAADLFDHPLTQFILQELQNP